MTGWLSPRQSLPRLLAASLLALIPTALAAAEQLPWNSGGNSYDSGASAGSAGEQDYGGYGYEPEQPYQPPAYPPPKRSYGSSGQNGSDYGSSYYGDQPGSSGGYVPPPAGGQSDPYAQGEPYDPPAGSTYGSAEPAYAPPPRPYQQEGGFTVDEINAAGHRFFGKISGGLARVIEHAFASQGQPNGYILGEEGGGAFVAGLRYGEGVLHTRDAGTHKVYWQGPSIGYDFGAEGSKTMILVYNLRSPDQIYQTFGGVGGQAYVVGGVGINYLSNEEHVVLAPIRSGLGLRLGANVGYLKYTQYPTWNPF